LNSDGNDVLHLESVFKEVYGYNEKKPCIHPGWMFFLFLALSAAPGNTVDLKPHQSEPAYILGELLIKYGLSQ
jgi:hypothetical protein